MSDMIKLCTVANQFNKKIFCSLLKELVHLNISYTKMPFYAVARGRTPGIFMSWADCETQVKGFSGAKYKKFDTVVKAQEYINEHSIGNSVPKTNTYKTMRVATTSSSAPKRSYSTASNGNSSNWTYQSKTVPPPKNQPENNSYNSDNFEDSDDLELNDILTKQLDDVEKRLKGFEKNIDKIIKKGTTSNRQSILIDPPLSKKSKSNGVGEFEEDDEGYVKVYTDGACSDNGRTGAKAGLGVYWSDGHPLNLSEPVTGCATNNCGEIQAATRAIQIALDNNIKKLSIITDSKFLINSVTKWMAGWKRNGWKLQKGDRVKNEKDFKDLDRIQNKLKIKWNHVEAHRGIHGNEMADQLAKAGAAMYVNK